MSNGPTAIVRSPALRQQVTALGRTVSRGHDALPALLAKFDDRTTTIADIYALARGGREPIRPSVFKRKRSGAGVFAKALIVDTNPGEVDNATDVYALRLPELLHGPEAASPE